MPCFHDITSKNKLSLQIIKCVINIYDTTVLSKCVQCTLYILDHAFKNIILTK